jgi:hypothetical protein
VTYPKWLTWQFVLALWVVVIVLIWVEWSAFRQSAEDQAADEDSACASIGSSPIALYLGGPLGDRVMCVGGAVVSLKR